MMDLFPSMLMLDYELNDPMGSTDFDLSVNFENAFGLAGGSDLLSEIFKDDKSFSSLKYDNISSTDRSNNSGHRNHRSRHSSKAPIYPTLTSKQRANKSRTTQSLMKAKSIIQQKHDNRRQYSSILSSTNSLIHSKQNPNTAQMPSSSVKSVMHGRPQPLQQQSAVNARNSTANREPAMPRVYMMQPGKKANNSVLSPAKQLISVAPSVGVQKELQPVAAGGVGAGISLLLKTPEKRKSPKKLQRKLRAKRNKNFLEALCVHDYDETIRKDLSISLAYEIERTRIAQKSENKARKAEESVISSDINSEKQRLNNDLEDIMNGFISEDVLSNELPTFLKGLFEGFDTSMLGNDATDDVLEGLSDACNFMENQFFDDVIDATENSDFNLTEDDLDQMIGFMGDFVAGKNDVDDSALESASDEQNTNTDKSEPGSSATSDLDEESDFFDDETLALSIANNKNSSPRRAKSWHDMPALLYYLQKQKQLSQ